MAIHNDMLKTVESVHAAGLDERLWPSALSHVTKMVGGVGTTLEAVDKLSMQLTDFWAHGVPPGSECRYVDQFISTSPRTALGFNPGADGIGYDYIVIDEATIKRDPYYAEFLRGAGLRYFVSGTLVCTPQEFVCLAVQRSPRQGHVDTREIALIRQILPHLRQAFDVTRRLRRSDAAPRALERTLNWLADGAALIRGDGAVIYVNEALQAMARRNEGIRLGKRRIEFASHDANVRYAQAVASACGLSQGELAGTSRPDFPAPRRSGGPHFLVSVRPLVRAVREARQGPHADAIVFVRDPKSQRRSSPELLCDTFGFTAAEADLAQALQAGVPLNEYARTRRRSLNTIYTHLRRIKEKAGCRRLSELMRRLNDLQPPLRPGKQ
jgi:DNA-binding CsgD family transcriptional regulator/PAS domain-containing protein